MRNLKNKLLAIAFFFLSVLSISAQWQSIDFPEQKGRITHIDLIDANTAYAVFFNSASDLSLEKTVDGGLTWIPLDSPIASIPFGFQGVHFFEEGKGVMLVRDLSDDIQPTKLYRTIDDGLTWAPIGPAETATGIGNGATQFLTKEIGFFSTDTFLYKTLDGGQNWSVYPIPGYIEYLDFVDADNGMIGLFDGSFMYQGGMYCTTDGGETWKGQFLNLYLSSIGHSVQANNNTAYTSANTSNTHEFNHYTIFVTKDAGLSWDSIPTPIEATDIDFAYVDIDTEEKLHVLVLSESTVSLYKRDEPNDTWEFEYSYEGTDILSADFTEDAIYLSGKLGQFYKKGLISSSEELWLNPVDVFPNPITSGDVLHLDGLDGPQDLKLVDLNGRLILSEKNFSSNSFRITDLSAGIYMLHLTSNRSEIVKPIIVK